ncbi:hypothetical protein ISF6_0254 [Piscinibacter sakaiensis]|uniref:Uncharacterized protein n=1 Tax=Piscinibacter sakaiensis TaxID=1547922 RepID=A0A0K8P8H8_PISS1|nr:hypothetical protein ISF6_0254 [Piscinibacter sakaiensis]
MRVTVSLMDPLTKPRSTSVAPASAAWSTKRWSVASGIAKLTKISTFGPALPEVIAAA